MSRSLLPAFLTLAFYACAVPLETGFQADLTEVCAARSAGGGGDLDLYAADADATVSMWVEVAGVLDGLATGDSLSETFEVDEVVTVHVTTGSNLREPCSDLAMNEVQSLHYTATAGSVDVSLEPYDDDGEPSWLATVVLRNVTLEPDEGGDAVDMIGFVFDAVEVWER